MSENGNDAGYGESPAETTSVFRADFLNELDNTSSAAPAAEQPVSGVEGLPPEPHFWWSSGDRMQDPASCSISRRRRQVGTRTATSSSTT